MKRTLSLLFLCLPTAVLFCSREPRRPNKPGGELVVTGANPLSGLDPAVVDHILSHMIAFHLFDGLLQYHPGDFKLSPALAERWEDARSRSDLDFSSPPRRAL